MVDLQKFLSSKSAFGALAGFFTVLKDIVHAVDWLSAVKASPLYLTTVQRDQLVRFFSTPGLLTKRLGSPVPLVLLKRLQDGRNKTQRSYSYKAVRSLSERYHECKFLRS